MVNNLNRIYKWVQFLIVVQFIHDQYFTSDPSFDMNLKSRFIQTFFIFKDKELENKDKKYDINNCI